MKKSEENAYSTKLKMLIELKNFVGKELGLTEWMKMSQKKINAFAKITHDEQWIHTDPEKSALFSPYKKTVAHGFLILSMVPTDVPPNFNTIVFMLALIINI